MISRRIVLGAAPVLLLAQRASAEAELEVLSERPSQLQTPLEYFDRLITPNEVFFVRSHHGPPRLNLKRKLTVTGLVETPLALDLDAIKALPKFSVTAVLQCAGNGRAYFDPPVPGVQWTEGGMGQAEWTGARLADVLTLAKVSSDAKHLHLFGADLPAKPTAPQFVRNLPLDKALEADTLLAYQMNGVPLPLAQGAPLRVIVPGWAGSYWSKWLTHIEVSQTEEQGFFVQRGYRMPDGPVAPGTKVAPEHLQPVKELPVKSIIARPLEGAVLPAGKQEISGVAFSGFGAIAKVEVSSDGGTTWTKAKLEGAPGLGRWQVFKASVDVRAGTQTVVARATDTKGNTQPRQVQWNPSGYHGNAWHSVSWTVS